MIHANMLYEEIPLLNGNKQFCLIRKILTKRKDKSAKIKYNMTLSLTLMC